jgi:CheY-like chemotaxis protein
MFVNFTIMVVDDDEDDIQLLHEALSEIRCTARLVPLLSADDFIHFLFGQELEVENSRNIWPSLVPDLILLDVNVPKVNGWQLLKFIRSHRALSCCKVVMLTTSANPNDRQKCKLAGADLYLVKPSSFTELVQLCTELLNDLVLTHSSVLIEERHATR